MREWQKLTPVKQTWAEWKVKFLATYAAKELSDKVREAVGQLFGGKSTKQPPTPGHKGDVPITNHMFDTLAGYLNNIAAATTNVGGGKELEDFVASMVILVGTNTAQANDLKQMCEQINALFKKSKTDVQGVEAKKNVTIVNTLDVSLPTERGVDSSTQRKISIGRLGRRI